MSLDSAQFSITFHSVSVPSHRWFNS